MKTWGLRCVLIGLLLQSAGCQKGSTSPSPSSSAESVWPSLSDFVELHRFTGNPPAWNERDGRARFIAAVSNHAELVAVANSFHSFDRDLPCSLLLYSQSGQLQPTLPVLEDATLQSVTFLLGDRLLLRYSNRENRVHNDRYRLYDTKSGKLVREFASLDTVRASPDGRWVASVHLFPDTRVASHKTPDPMALSVWEAKTGNLLRVMKHPTPLRDFAFSPDGDSILTPLADRLIEWDVHSGEIRFESEKSDKPYAGVAYSPDGRRWFATTEEPNGLDDDVDHQLRGWDVASGTRLPITDYAFASYNGNERLFFFPDGNQFIDLEAKFSVRDVLTGETLQTAPKYTIPAHEVAFMLGPASRTGSFSADGRFYLTKAGWNL